MVVKALETVVSHLHVTRLDFSCMIQFYVGGYCCRLSEAPFGMRCATNIFNANKLDSCGDDQVLMVIALIYTQLFWANVRGTPSFVLWLIEKTSLDK